uniref:Uncharacterized protein n=1 Tax=Setaria viridis TaxID=4556 RepID=A0A4U6TFX4_SETVI|nr:hypothetical protein SEVIR_8G062350v2 [Setaria viridis]
MPPLFVICWFLSMLLTSHASRVCTNHFPLYLFQ